MISRLLCRLLGHPAWIFVARVERLNGRQMVIVRCSDCDAGAELTAAHYWSLLETER